jgi:hypothetical protein
MRNLGTASRVNDTVAQAVFAAIASPATPLMVFGSVARGDGSAVSDVDVLEISRRPSRSYKVGRVHVYPYDETQLRRMAAAGSLFVLHLRREGKIVRDPDGVLASCIAAYRPPVSYEAYRKVLRATARLLDADARAYVSRWKDYNDLAIFVLRTALYIQFAESDEPLFSLSEIAKRLDLLEMSTALGLKNAKEPDFAVFSMAKILAARFLGADIHNPFGTVEALVTNEGLENPPLLAFGLRLLGNPSPALGYDILSFSPLG